MPFAERIGPRAELPASMEALVYRGPGSFVVEARPVPAVRPGTVLLRVEACGVCGSDLRLLRSGSRRIQPGRVLGHEVAGTVVALGTGAPFAVGTRLSVGSDLPCGRCRWCALGRPNRCATNLALADHWDGGFADYMLVPEPVFAGGPVQVIPEGLPASTAALSEPLACCLNAWESIPRYDGGRLVVLGAGAMGRLLARLGRACFGIEEVTFVEPIPARRQAVLAEADRVVDAADADAVLALRGVEGEGPDVVMVACADRRAQEWALSIVGRGGAVNLFAGLAAPDTAIPLRSDDVHYRELIVTASHGSTPRQHRDALALLASGTVPADGVLADPVPLLDLPDAVQRAADGVPGKAWFQPSVERVP